MKRLIAPLFALCGLFSCSSDKDEIPPNSVTPPPSGMFVAVNDDEALIIYLQDGQCHQFTVWESDGSWFYVQGFTTSGQWPRFQYAHSGNGQMEMSATFQNDTTFIADFNANPVMQDLDMNATLQTMTFTMEAKGVRFTEQDGPLDVNGDGIPDVLQPKIYDN